MLYAPHSHFQTMYCVVLSMGAGPKTIRLRLSFELSSRLLLVQFEAVVVWDLP